MLEHIGHFRILDRLGRGRLGVTYRALEPDGGRQVALRVVPLPDAGDANRQEGLRVLRAAVRAAAELDHPNIAAVYEEGDALNDDPDADPGVYFISSALVEGGTLSDKLHGEGRIDAARAHKWLMQILLALDHAHAHGIVHADLKPANVLVAANDDVVITDFGLNKSNIYELTEVGAIVGTPDYVSPEQLLGEAATVRSDVYSAGVLLYRMLTGQRPFEGGAATVMQHMLTDTPTAPSDLVQELGTAFDSVVAKAMAPRPDKRYASAGQFLRDLNRASFLLASQEMAPAVSGSPARPAGTVRALRLAPARASAQPAPPAPVAPAEDWKASSAAPLEAVFSEAFGPMTRGFVRYALASAASFEAAVARLASQVPSAAAQRNLIEAAHLSVLAQPAAEASGTHPPNHPEPAAGTSPGSSPGGLIDAATLSQAAERLSDDAGPMARILVNRASARARSRTEFFRMLAESIPEPRQRQKFLRDFGYQD